MPDTGPHITISKDDPGGFVLDSLLLEKVRAEKFIFISAWNDSVKRGDSKFNLTCEIARKIGTPLFVNADARDCAVGLSLRDRSIVKFWLGDKKLEFEVWSKTHESAVEEVRAVRKLAEPYLVAPENDSEISVVFWYSNAKGDVKNDTRTIVCPSWQDIRENYLPDVRSDIESLIAMEKPWEAGKIIFWSGVAGGGKTFAIRSLVREWRDVVDPQYVMDPEKFFGDAQYMNEAVMTDTGFKYDEDGNRRPTAVGKLFVIEDMPDLILTKSRSTRCAEMARLLNLSDGLIGQGFSALFLLTTNEDVHDIDPAFLRDGRILQRTAFTKLGPDEARQWLRDHGSTADVDGEMTLAELYARLRGKKAKPRSQDHKVGFAVRKP